MESDYHLHNKNIQAGKGTTVSMKTYQRAFGIDRNTDESNTQPAKPLTIAQQRLSASSRTPFGSRSFVALPNAHASTNKQNDESKCVMLVRHRCKTQEKALSNWWKVALQSYFKERMWTKLKIRHYESDLPSRFERVYQPEKIGQFDRVFSRAWETPVRRSHAAQHSESMEDDKTADFTRLMAFKFTEPSKVVAKLDEKRTASEIPLKKWIGEAGFALQFESSLTSFTQYFESPSQKPFEYVGDNTEAKKATIPKEYELYCASSYDVFGNPQSYKSDRIQEFERGLHDFALNADDVFGIKEACMKQIFCRNLDSLINTNSTTLILFSWLDPRTSVRGYLMENITVLRKTHLLLK